MIERTLAINLTPNEVISELSCMESVSQAYILQEIAKNFLDWGMAKRSMQLLFVAQIIKENGYKEARELVETLNSFLNSKEE